MTDEIADILALCKQKRIRLWSEHGHLFYEAPAGALTLEEIAWLRHHRDRLLALLSNRPSAQLVEPKLVRRRDTDRAPLTYSQLSHWHMHQLGVSSHIRQVASVTRLRGRLDLHALTEGIAEIVSRHEALRTQIIVQDDRPIQEVLKTVPINVDLLDLSTASSRGRDVMLQRSIDEHIMEPINVTVDPLFGARIVKIDRDDHILITSMEHIISDGISSNILVRDLLETYRSNVCGGMASLPTIEAQFADYALYQARTQESWIASHRWYWAECLRQYKRLKFPQPSNNERAELSPGWNGVSVRFGAELKTELREWCRVRHTTLAMTFFAAYAALVLRWCNVSETVIRYQASGRVTPEVENTIGYFASAIYVRVELRDGDDFDDVVRRVTDEYCMAQEHIDFCYLESQVPRPEFTRNTTFNWVPRSSQTDSVRPFPSPQERAIVVSSVAYTHPMMKHLAWDAEPVILLFDTDSEIVGHVYFPCKKFSTRMMERFARNFERFVRALVERPEAQPSKVMLE